VNKDQTDAEDAQQAGSHRRITITINGNTYLHLLKQAEQEGQPLSQVITGIIEQQLSKDLPSNQGSKRLTISLPHHTHAALLKRKHDEQKSLSGLVSCMLDSAKGMSPSASA